MGFYLRKSKSLGPLRLNLSKSGLGFSVGTKGARVGVNSKGKKYVHAGRGGLYYRQEFPSGKTSPPSPYTTEEPQTVPVGVVLVVALLTVILAAATVGVWGFFVALAAALLYLAFRK